MHRYSPYPPHKPLKHPASSSLSHVFSSPDTSHDSILATPLSDHPLQLLFECAYSQLLYSRDPKSRCSNPPLLTRACAAVPCSPQRHTLAHSSAMTSPLFNSSAVASQSIPIHAPQPVRPIPKICFAPPEEDLLPTTSILLKPLSDPATHASWSGPADSPMWARINPWTFIPPDFSSSRPFVAN